MSEEQGALRASPDSNPLFLCKLFSYPTQFFFFLNPAVHFIDIQVFQSEGRSPADRPLWCLNVARGLSLHNPICRWMEAEWRWRTLKWVSATCYRYQVLDRARVSQFVLSGRQPSCLATGVWQKVEAGKKTSDLGYRGRGFGRRKSPWFYSV